MRAAWPLAGCAQQNPEWHPRMPFFLPAPLPAGWRERRDSLQLGRCRHPVSRTISLDRSTTNKEQTP